jgi:hypothetical protein
MLELWYWLYDGLNFNVYLTSLGYDLEVFLLYANSTRFEVNYN